LSIAKTIGVVAAIALALAFLSLAAQVLLLVFAGILLDYLFRG